MRRDTADPVASGLPRRADSECRRIARPDGDPDCGRDADAWRDGRTEPDGGHGHARPDRDGRSHAEADTDRAPHRSADPTGDADGRPDHRADPTVDATADATADADPQPHEPGRPQPAPPARIADHE